MAAFAAIVIAPVTSFEPLILALLINNPLAPVEVLRSWIVMLPPFVLVDKLRLAPNCRIAVVMD